MMSDSDTLHRLLYLALIEIRGYGDDTKHKGILALADLFHSIVLEMGRAVKSEIPYADVMTNLKTKAAENGCERWLAVKLDQLAGSAPTDRAADIGETPPH